MNTYETTFKRQDIHNAYRSINIEREQLQQQPIKLLSNTSLQENVVIMSPKTQPKLFLNSNSELKFNSSTGIISIPKSNINKQYLNTD